MQASVFLARLLGPLLLLPGVGLLVNPRVFRTMATEVVGSLTLVYLFGLFDFAAGLAIVLVHRVSRRRISTRGRESLRKAGLPVRALRRKLVAVPLANSK
jgi:hypothetical protein